MNFKEALDCLKNGKRISRPSWSDSLHLFMVESLIFSSRRSFNLYEYSLDAITTDGWIDFDNKESKPVTFHEAIIAMANGFKVTRKDWDDDTYLSLDSNKFVISSSLVKIFFVPSPIDILSNDWIAE